MQKSIDQSLEFVEGQQSELEGLLGQLENQIRDVFDGGDGKEPIRVTPADVEREKTYNMSVQINGQLDEMGVQLSQMISEINYAQASNSSGVSSGANGSLGEGQGGEGNTITQIVRILDQHLASLQWLDKSSAELGERVKALSDGSRGI
ncbi:FG-nucleoporin nsp1 [Nowakowskiella sp. JEL0407]|nr:FG-nucleoporin nsp1 [Nowakowskiella sp. JEL0407]